jgi:hypothetical protein
LQWQKNKVCLTLCWKIFVIDRMSINFT